MRSIIATSVLACLLAVPTAAQEAEAALPQLTMEQRSSLRCGVAFGLIARGQAEGDARAAAYPAMEPRGREFFVRTMARLMDEHGLTREQANKLALATTSEMMAETPQDRERMMPACLLLLEASGL